MRGPWQDLRLKVIDLHARCTQHDREWNARKQAQNEIGGRVRPYNTKKA